MNVVPVDDAGDPRVADYRHLTDAQLRRDTEARGRFFVAEGTHVIRQLLLSPYRVRSVLLTPAKLEVLAPDLREVTAPVYVAEAPVMKQVAGFDIHRGAIASADRRPLPAPADVLRTATRLAVLEEMNDHENLGALFRNAAAFGFDGVLLSPTCADPLYRRSVRVSLGHVLRMPYTTLGDWPGGLDSLRAAGFTVLALTPDPAAEPLDALAAPEKMAVLLGAEGPGLTEAAAAAADRRVRIPMARAVDSLNVATAAAVAFYALTTAAAGRASPPATG